MAVPQHHQHDQLELIKRKIFLFQRHGAIDDHFAFDRGNQALLFCKQQELAGFVADMPSFAMKNSEGLVADMVQFRFCKMTMSRMLKTFGIAVGILFLQSG